MEGIAPVTVFLLVGGLAPRAVWAALVGGVVYAVGRVLYAVGYVRSVKNGEGRTLGAVVLDIALLTLLGCAVYSPVYILHDQP